MVHDIWTQNSLKVDKIEKGTISFGNVTIFSDAMGQQIDVPILVAKGVEEGPTLGLTAAIHGNEINGISVIQNLFHQINTQELRGTVVGVPVLNIPGYLSNRRTFLDGIDLNRIMPGKKIGTPSEIYAYRIFNHIIKQFDFLLDLHTASFGRENTHYVRADLSDPILLRIAELQNPQIIVHATRPKNSLRNAAIEQGIPSVTVELGNPQIFQERIVDRAIIGIRNLMSQIEMINDPIIDPKKPPVKCNKSFWIRSNLGGIIEVFPKLAQIITKGDKIAILSDLHGFMLKEYFAPNNGVVVGREINPVTTTGGRIIHLGVQGDVTMESDTAFDDEYENLFDYDEM